MSSSVHEPVLEFAGFRFGADRGLSRAGRSIRLSRKELRGLALLLARRGKVVSRDQYAQAVWPRGEVSDDSMARSIYLLRRALGRSEAAQFVETVYGLGYRIGVPVREAPASTPPTAAKLVEGVSPAAFETFQLARERLARRTPSDLEAGIRAFRRAADIDPGYAAAWAAIADCHIAQAMRWYVGPLEAGRLALEAAERALAIDPEAASALAARGWVRGVIEQSVRDGLADLDRAVSLDPHYWLARFYRAWLLPALGEYDQALEEARVACELNPLHPAPHTLVGWLLFCSGRTPEALTHLRSGCEELGGPPEVLRALSVVAAWAGLRDEAVGAARRVAATEGAVSDGTSVLAYALARAGDELGACRIARAWREDVDLHPPPTHMAAVHLALGDRQRASAAWALARGQSCPHWVFAGGDPRLEPLRASDFETATASPATPRCDRSEVFATVRSESR